MSVQSSVRAARLLAAAAKANSKMESVAVAA